MRNAPRAIGLNRLCVRFFLGALIGIAMAVGLLWRETNALTLEQAEVPVADLPPQLDGLRIALISDLHGKRFAPDGRLVQLVRAADVGLIAAVGDFVDRDIGEMAGVLPLMQALAQVAPVYAVSGNHDCAVDWPQIARQLRQVGVTVLENACCVRHRNGVDYCLAGLSDHLSGEADLRQALPDSSSGPIILLSHSPTLFDPDWTSGRPQSRGSDWAERRQLLQRVTLTLSGHTHGGQIKLPLIGAVTNGSGTLFPRQRVQGLSREQGGWLYITRGLGTTGIIRARFLSRPELTILTLRSGE